MKYITSSIISLLLFPSLAHGQNFKNDKLSYSDEISGYVDFINSCNTDPVDYIFSLFDKYDVVVFGERDHRDMTQYDLIERIIKDERFINNIGHIMTEAGVNNLTAQANSIINPTVFDDNVFESDWIEHIRDTDEITAYWEMCNFKRLHRDIYDINRNVGHDKKIGITYLSPALDWHQTGGISHEEFMVMRPNIDRQFYDVIMAENAINKLYEIFRGSDSRKKALLILNRPHSYKRYSRTKTLDVEGATALISERLPGRVANVMLNSALVDETGPCCPVQNGKWDAAFSVCGNKPIGFNFADTVFGNDEFDHYGKAMEGTSYSDIFTGFIYYAPPCEWEYSMYYDNFVDEQFGPEFKRRMQIIYGDDYEEEYFFYKTKKHEAGKILDEETRQYFQSVMSQYIY